MICTYITKSGLGIRSFAHSLFTQVALLLIRSSLTLLFFKERQERFDLVAHYKRAILSDSLFTKERLGVIHFRCSLQMSERSDLLFFKSESLFRFFALFAHKNDWFTWKTKERIPNPAHSPSTQAMNIDWNFNSDFNMSYSLGSCEGGILIKQLAWRDWNILHTVSEAFLVMN